MSRSTRRSCSLISVDSRFSTPPVHCFNFFCPFVVSVRCFSLLFLFVLSVCCLFVSLSRGSFHYPVRTTKREKSIHSGAFLIGSTRREVPRALPSHTKWCRIKKRDDNRGIKRKGKEGKEEKER